jgi:hypothetical protein
MKTKIFKTEKEAINAADNQIDKSINSVDFKIIENAIISGNDATVAHFYKMYTEHNNKGFCVCMGLTHVNYNALSNKITHTYTPTIKLERSFMLAELQDSARKIAAINAKAEFLKQYIRLWYHDGRKFCQIK